MPAVASLGLRSVAAQGPASTIACGADCAFEVSAAGLLTQTETSVGACAANCLEFSGGEGGAGITDIAPGAFTNLPKVTSISLSDNLLTSIKTGTFDGLPKLREIHLRNNKIVSIEAGAIRNAPELDKIDLIDQSPSLQVDVTTTSQANFSTTNVRSLPLHQV